MKTKKMTREQVEQYRAGWQKVKELEAAEAKRKSYATRWREINMLFEFAYELGLIKPASEAELAPIRARWAHLKANYP